VLLPLVRHTPWLEAVAAVRRTHLGRRGCANALRGQADEVAEEHRELIAALEVAVDVHPDAVARAIGTRRENDVAGLDHAGGLAPDAVVLRHRVRAFFRGAGIRQI